MTKIFSETKIEVRYAETDQMGIVHHASYIVYFEVARIDWLSKLGFTYKKMEDDGVMLPVVSLTTNFKKSAFFGDVLTVKTSLKKMPNVKIEFCYEIFNKKGELLTTGETTLVFMCVKKRRPIKCPENIIKVIENYSDSIFKP